MSSQSLQFAITRYRASLRNLGAQLCGRAVPIAVAALACDIEPSVSQLHEDVMSRAVEVDSGTVERTWTGDLVSRVARRYLRDLLIDRSVPTAVSAGGVRLGELGGRPQLRLPNARRYFLVMPS